MLLENKTTTSFFAPLASTSVSWVSGDARALQHFTTVWGEAVQSGDKRKEACAKGQLAMICYRRGDIEEAIDHFEVARGISQIPRNPNPNPDPD